MINFFSIINLLNELHRWVPKYLLLHHSHNIAHYPSNPCVFPFLLLPNSQHPLTPAHPLQYSLERVLNKLPNLTGVYVYLFVGYGVCWGQLGDVE